jgi:hypothetical protein
MTLRLRPHHLLCLLTYAGEGYSDAFIANFNTVIHRLRRGEDVLIVSGPDDICVPLLDLDEGREPHCLRKSVSERDRIAANTVSRFVGYRIVVGEKIILDLEFLHRMRRAFTSGQTRQACIGCEWSELCSSIALNNYAKTLIQT